MEKSLNLHLNRYPIIPNSLRVSKPVNSPSATVNVGLAGLFHHYYLDSYGKTPPNPDPSLFEHVQFLLPSPDFRFQGSGLGISPAIKRHRSNELGQAFCRWFLHEHLNITYFAHLEALLRRQLHRAFEGFSLKRSSTGDTPDYFCAENVNRVFLAEAKGRYTPISFASIEFAKWRAQFSRVSFLDSAGVPLSIKGHIVATRFATEDGPRIQSGIWAEDPQSPGEISPDFESSSHFGRAIIASHYSNLATKVGQPLLATSLANGVALPEEILIPAVAWRVVAGPLEGVRFIGGYYGAERVRPRSRGADGRIFFDRNDPLRLDQECATFFGIEESIFREVVTFSRSKSNGTFQLSTFEDIDFFYSGFSVLRDGSAIGPIDFFSPEESVVF